MALATVPLRPAPPAAAALLVVAGGSAGALLAFYLIALLAGRAGFGLPGLVTALDPASPGSLPALWGAGWLGLAAIVALVVGCRGGEPALLRLALLPMILGVVEAADLAARLEPEIAGMLGVASGTAGAKLLGAGLAGGLVLIAAVSAACGRSAVAATGRKCLAALLVAGSLSLTCDVAASLCKGSVLGRALVALEEAAELGLYAFLASLVLGSALETAFQRSVAKWDDCRSNPA